MQMDIFPAGLQIVKNVVCWYETPGERNAMKTTSHNTVKQPAPFTPGVTKEMVRQHAFRVYADKLKHGSLTLEDWVLAEKDLAANLQAEVAE